MLERAVEHYRREQFFVELDAAYARLQADPVAWADELAERAELEERWAMGSMTCEARSPWRCLASADSGTEQTGQRPVLIVSSDRFNQGRARLIVAVPFTTRDRGLPIHVGVHPDGGLRDVSFAMCEQVRPC